MLTVAAAAVAEPAVQALIESPAVTDQQKAHGLIDVVRDELDDAGRRFLHTLADNKRLTLLPEIGTQFEALKAEAERVLDVEIASAVPLSDAELDRFTDALKRRYERDIQLSTVVDAELIGGAVVRAGDTVVDGSVRGKLDKLAESLRQDVDRAPNRIEERRMQQLNPSEISDLIKDRIESLDIASQPRNEGSIVSVSDGIVRIHGLAAARYGEMIEFPGGIYGMALNLERDSVGVVVLGDYEGLSEGMTARCTERILEVPVGPGLLGRVVDSLGNPLDGKGPIDAVRTEPIEKVAPGVIARQSVSQPVQMGMKCIDAMVPIGRGQRELIIGDRQIGKTAIAVDAVINQKDSGIKCIYVAIGQKMSTIANIVRTFEESGAMDHTVVVAASASTPAPMQYISAYSGCTIGEYFRDTGQDALVIYDDLTKQAWAYRQISLLLRRPPGREAYPGDVFYLHSRLLERAARVNAEYVEQVTNGEVKGQTGSLTALPIIETQAGDVSAFVPTNVISITDGQIFLETDRFNSGIRPAMSPGISVSRVGGSAQVPFMKKISGGVKMALAQYRELAAFSQFASDLDEATRRQLEHGARVEELMKQPQYAPMTVAEMGVSLYAANEGYLEDVPVERVLDFERDLLAYMNSEHSEWMAQITESGAYDDDIEAFMKETLDQFKSTHSYS